jgi:hypothetical protein
MDMQLFISFGIVLFALAGFFVLAQTLWRTWEAKGWMDGLNKTNKAGGQFGVEQRGEWKESACYRYCMGQTFSGIGSPYFHCAAKCGLR